ncbi:diguanylate cyclase (GGDEF)-like protein/PAS domain S-box-containing protein [Desulfobaculum xiamenense]|uniref:Diguanylate cyclase (GGDEF)-like protein/PAS domain S-box-containing protein n=1 Tax=Desulfobaculum xiamenense TaxID=995050 RepID=A0A846QKQ1_9BACT|nr:EAL domain-containing protein [Desulfobaculum xiamenense]NJB67630.1 diguanylate cyclase (GGDEF)-like protein/PAS domain S-box-containing protein [Desulfobaculum xiamenense]
MTASVPSSPNDSRRHTGPGSWLLTVLSAAGALLALAALAVILRPQHSTNVVLNNAERHFLHEHPYLRVGIDREFVPLQFTDANGKARGFSVDYLNLLGVNIGANFEFVGDTWENLPGRLERGEIDLIADMTPTPERQKRFAFTEPVSSHTTHIYVPTHIVEVENLDDLAGRKVGVPAGTALADVVSRHGGFAVIPYRGAAQGLSGLTNGDFDAVVDYTFAFRHTLFKTETQGFKEVGQPVTREDGCLAVTRNNSVLLSILDKGILSIREEQKLSIERKWVGAITHTDSIRHLLQTHAAWLALAAAAVAGIALWNLFLQIGIRRRIADAKSNEARFTAIYANSHDAILILRNMLVVDANPTTQRLLDMSRKELEGQRMTSVIPGIPEAGPYSRQVAQDHYRRAAAGHPQSFEWRLNRPDEKPLDLEIDLHSFHTDEGSFVVAQMRDITSRKRAERELRKQRALLRQLFENSPLAVVMVDTDVNVLDANGAFEELFQFSRSDVQGQHLDSLIVSPELMGEASSFNASIRTGGTVQHETMRRRRDGADVHVAIAASPIMFEGNYIGSYCIYADITDRKIAERQLTHMAFYDRLTGLPNRSMLLDRLTQAISHATADPHYAFALLYLDLDRFKVINDSLGHSTGDLVIEATAGRLRDTLPNVDTISRVAGDEFAVLLTGSITADVAAQAARGIQLALRRPLTVGGHVIQTSAGVGVVMGPQPHASAEFMLRDAEIALYRAKERGLGGLETFTPQMHTQAMHVLEMEADLRRAVEQREFVMHYQPIIDLDTKHLAGFEALIRWEHPTRGLISPGDFIQTAEETGLIIPIGQQVLEMSLRRLADWRKRFPAHDDMFMSINLSARQFTLHDLDERIRATAEAANAPLGAVKLEITESVVMENALSAARQLARLKRLGVSLSVDDFGTGYSSLSYLYDFPVDTIKVDRSFVTRIGAGDEKSKIVHAIIQMAHALNMNVIAEGVELPAQAELLGTLGCDLAQGYLYARPLTSVQAEALIVRMASTSSTLRTSATG